MSSQAIDFIGVINWLARRSLSRKTRSTMSYSVASKIPASSPSLSKTLKAVFPGVRIHTNGDGGMFFVATDRPLLAFVHPPDLANIHPEVLRDTEATYAGVVDPDHAAAVPVAERTHEPPRRGERHRAQVAFPGQFQLRLPRRSFLFFFAFDYFSFIERKNPMAVIDAFRAAFLTIAAFTTAGFFLALSNPLKRI